MWLLAALALIDSTAFVRVNQVGYLPDAPKVAVVCSLVPAQVSSFLVRDDHGRTVAGPDSGNYITIFALTQASRDKYWPGGSDSDDLRAAFAPVKVHTKELLTYLADNSALTDDKYAAAVYESREWADFVLLPSAR